MVQFPFKQNFDNSWPGSEWNAAALVASGVESLDLNCSVDWYDSYLEAAAKTGARIFVRTLGAAALITASAVDAVAHAIFALCTLSFAVCTFPPTLLVSPFAGREVMQISATSLIVSTLHLSMVVFSVAKAVFLPLIAVVDPRAASELANADPVEHNGSRPSYQVRDRVVYRQNPDNRLLGAELEQSRIEVARLTEEIAEARARIHRPVARAYNKRPNDPSDIQGNFVERYCNNRSMEQVISQAFSHTVNFLQDNSDSYTYDQLTGDNPPADAREFHVSDSLGFVADAVSCQSFFRLAALDLISHAALETDCQGKVSLVVNEPGRLAVGWSDPVRISEANGDSTLFRHHDEWTPVGGTALNGVDPISVKWILHRLRNDETALRHLKYLLLDPFTLDTNEHLQAAKAFVRAQNRSERQELVKTAYELLCDIGASLHGRYYGMPALTTIMQDKFDDYEKPLFTKPEIELPVEPNPIVAIQPQYELMPEAMVLPVALLKSKLEPLYLHMSEDLLQGSRQGLYDGMALPGLNNLTGLYRYQHNYDNHGCLIDALCTLIFGQRPTVEHGRLLKRAMANFLRVEENANQYSSEIQNRNGSSVAGYIDWLEGRRHRDNYAASELEIEIVSQIIGIKFETFVNGENIYFDENGLVKPTEGRMVGPNTKEKLSLFNSQGASYYSLMPKLRNPQNGDSPELRSALEAVNGQFAGLGAAI